MSSVFKHLESGPGPGLAHMCRPGSAWEVIANGQPAEAVSGHMAHIFHELSKILLVLKNVGLVGLRAFSELMPQLATSKFEILVLRR